MKNNKSKIFTILTFLGIYLLSTGVSFAVFNYLSQPLGSESITSPSETAPKGGFLVDTSGPKTESCPLNGKKFTKAEREVWEKRRPLTIMVENHQEARPQSGILRADVVYEAVAEGGITRFMAVFYCDAVAKEEIIGPVRSARTYFLDWASEYGPGLYAHVGGAHCDSETGEGCQNGGKADALGQISDYGWAGGNDLNQFSIGFPTFWRDYERIGHTVATEHTMYTTTEKLWAVGKKRDWTNESPEGEDWQEEFESWQFKEDAEDSDRGETDKIEFVFWEGHSEYKVLWEYDKENNFYKRFNGDKEHKDLNYDQQLTVKNIAVLSMAESPANDGYPGNIHLLYQTIGEGKAWFFVDGKAVDGKWSKRSRTARTKFFDTKGREIVFNMGKIWVEIVPAGTKISY